MSKLTDELGLEGAPQPVIEQFHNSEPLFDGEADKCIKNYREDVLDSDVNAESSFEELYKKYNK